MEKKKAANKKYVCLRDDDTCFTTSITELRDAYGWIFGKYPITLGVVPFSHGSQRKMTEFEEEDNRFAALRNWELSASPNDLTNYHTLHPLGENNALVEGLKELVQKGMVEIAQHGVSHRYTEFGPEMEIPRIALPQIRDGKEYLSKLFDTEIVTFIPPSNTLDYRTALYIKSLGMNILTCGDIKYRNFAEKIVSKFKDPLFIKNRIKRNKSRPISKPSGIVMLNSITYNNFNSRVDIFNKVKSCLEKDGFASITTHYMLFNRNGWLGKHKEYRDEFAALIKQISEIENVVFVTAREYGELLIKEFYKEK